MITNAMCMLFNDYKSSCLLCILVCEHEMGMKLQVDHLFIISSLVVLVSCKQRTIIYHKNHEMTLYSQKGITIFCKCSRICKKKEI